MKRLIALLVFLAATLASDGQTAVKSLDSCVEYALSHNCDILLGKSAAARSREDLRQSKLDLLPSLNLYVNQYYNWGRSVDMQELVIVRNRLTRQTSGSVGASLPLFDGLQRINTIAMNRHRAAAAAQNVKQKTLDVKTDIAGAYLAEILARLTAARLEQSLENADAQLEIVRHKYNGGAAKRSDCLEMEAHKADIQGRLAAALSEQNTQMEQLCALMGCDENFCTDTCIEAAIIPPPERVWEELDVTVPSVAEAESSVAAAKSALRVAKGALLPSLTLSAAYGTYYSDASPDPFKEQLDGNRNPSVSLSLAVPVFDGGRSMLQVEKCRSEVKESSIRLEQARQQAELYRIRIKEEAATLYAQLAASISKRDFCRERLRELTAAHRSGAATTSEWIDASEASAQAECECAQCQCKYIFQLKMIEYYRDGCR